MQKIKVGIAGLGGIGGLLAVLLAKKKIEVFALASTNQKFKEINLVSNYFGNLNAKINTKKNLNSMNLIFICSKFFSLKKHLKNIKNDKAIVVPFLNGILHYKILENKFKKNYLVSNIGKVVSLKISKSKIQHVSNNAPEVLISSQKKNKIDIKIVQKILQKIKFKVKIKNKDSAILWEKFIRLSPISALTALYDCNLGDIKSSELKMNELRSLIKEALKISKKSHNFSGNFSKINRLIKSFPDNLTTSLQRDINNNSKSEIETQIGSIVKMAKKHNISSPMYKKIYLLLKKKCQKKS